MTSFNSDDGCLLLNVPSGIIKTPDWLKNLSIEEGFSEKNEYHVTVIGKNLAEKIAGLNLSGEVRALAGRVNWTVEFLSRYIELAKDDADGIHRQSIIQLVSVPQFKTFFEDLEALIKQPIPRPPEHVTLYTKNYSRGIGLYGIDDLKRYTVRALL